MAILWRSQTGCYIDGSFGMDHTVAVMAQLLSQAARAGSTEAEKLLEEYDDGFEEGDDFAQEWLDDATNALEEVTAAHLTWAWDGGDLCLREVGGDE